MTRGRISSNNAILILLILVSRTLYSCERTVKSGHLSDLLTCVSAGSRVCVHPWLSNPNFPSVVSSLAADRQPAPSPSTLVTLSFYEILAGLLRLRSEQVETHQLLLLKTTQATHVRRRLVELLPTTEQMKAIYGGDVVKPAVQNGNHVSAAKKPKMDDTVFFDEATFSAVLLEESAKASMSKLPVSPIE